MSKVKTPTPAANAVCIVCGKPITRFEPWGFTKIRNVTKWFHEACAKGGSKA